MNIQSGLVMCLAFAAFTANPVNAQDEDELLWSFGDEDFVSIATGRKQTISKAPAVASVITAEQIRAIGARDIDEALETVTGLHVSRSAAGYNPIYVIRGIHSQSNSQVLVLINGVPITSVYSGDRSGVWGGMPVENISRIEVIRGPGSAVYGADAFAGTINIVTKTAGEIAGLEMGYSTGSFDTQRGWLQYGDTINDWEVAFSLQLSDTEGQEEKITADFQTALDNLFTPGCQALNSCASLAPAGVSTGSETMDARADIKKGHWQIRAGYQNRRDIGAGAGVAQVIDPVGDGNSRRFNVDITYHNTQLAEHWDVQATLSHYDMSTEVSAILFPSGAFGGLFPNGVIGEPKIFERHYRYDQSAFYNGIENHDIRIGSGYHFLDQYQIEEKKNYQYMGLIPIPLGAVTAVTGSDLFNRASTREVTYLFVQDEYRFARDWSITAGLRYDHFSDFGETINPRFAMVWETAYNLTSKLLYGKAFRAPSFAEQFNQANPVAIGNSKLDPEIIETYELAFTYLPSSNLKVGFNLFHYNFEDIIRFTPVAENSGDQTGNGVELELDWKINDKITLHASGAFQSSEDDELNEDAPNAPEQQIYLSVNYELSPVWSFNTQVNNVANRNRQAGDIRDIVDDYTTVNFTIKAEKLFAGFDGLLSIKNLTDDKVIEPSAYDQLTNTVAIPNDLPQAGRSVMFEIRKSWNN